LCVKKWDEREERQRKDCVVLARGSRRRGAEFQGVAGGKRAREQEGVETSLYDSLGYSHRVDCRGDARERREARMSPLFPRAEEVLGRLIFIERQASRVSHLGVARLFLHQGELKRHARL
jgi:hypothetical protein